MTPPEEHTHTIIIPMVDSIHQALVAFLQTSDQGIWELDGNNVNNQFTLHLLRGNWARSFFGLGAKRVPAACDVDAQGEFLARTKPMLLEVTIRPSPEEIRINLRHSVFTKYQVAREDVDEYRRFWKHIVRNEVDSLRQYLTKCYNLDHAPKLEAV